MKMPRPSKNKNKIKQNALKSGRKVLWKDKSGVWHAAINRQNIPNYAVEIEELDL